MNSQTERIEYKLSHSNWDSKDQKRKAYEEMYILSSRLDDLEKIFFRKDKNG